MGWPRLPPNLLHWPAPLRRFLCDGSPCSTPSGRMVINVVYNLVALRSPPLFRHSFRVSGFSLFPSCRSWFPRSSQGYPASPSCSSWHSPFECASPSLSSPSDPTHPVSDTISAFPGCVRPLHVLGCCSLAFFGFLRVSEFTCSGPFDPRLHLSLSDVWFDPSGSIRLLIKSSKTDPCRRGVILSIGPSGNSLCPVSALRHYLQLRGFVPGPLFVSSHGCPLSPFLVNSWLRSILATVGIAGNYSSHSFRNGAATSAAAAGVPDHLIKTLGRWSSNAYQPYIRTPPHLQPRTQGLSLGKTLASAGHVTLIKICSRGRVGECRIYNYFTTPCCRIRSRLP